MVNITCPMAHTSYHKNMNHNNISQRIAKVELDESTILWRNADIEQERRIAIFDLIEDNIFEPQKSYADDYAGPYNLQLSVQEGRLIWDIRTQDDEQLETLIFGLARFRRPIKDYFAITTSRHLIMMEIIL